MNPEIVFCQIFLCVSFPSLLQFLRITQGEPTRIMDTLPSRTITPMHSSINISKFVKVTPVRPFVLLFPTSQLKKLNHWLYHKAYYTEGCMKYYCLQSLDQFLLKTDPFRYALFHSPIWIMAM